MLRISGATVKKVGRTDIETHTAKEEKRGAKTKNPGNIDIVMRTVRARKTVEETELETQAMDTVSETGREVMNRGEIMSMDATTATRKDISTTGDKGSLAVKAGTKTLQPSRAAQRSDR